MQDYWTEDRVEALKRHWANGLTASQIARRMGDISRNAVIGKVSRLGLPRRLDGKPGSKRVYVRPPKVWHQSVQEKLSEAASRSWQQPRQPVNRQRPTTLRQAKKPPLPIEPLPLPVDDFYVAPENRKRLLDLEPNDCRWPLGDPRAPDFHFCAGPKVPGFSYCQHHVRAGHQTVQEVDARRLRAMKAA